LANLYLDHNMSLHLVPQLRSAGHDVVSARDAGSARLTDDAQLLLAARERRVPLTHNRGDFVLLHDAWNTWPNAFGLALPPHPGILVLDPAPVDILFPVVDAILGSMQSGTIANGLFHCRRHGDWRSRDVGRRWVRYVL
jgi:hypothetical protein